MATSNIKDLARQATLRLQQQAQEKLQWSHVGLAKPASFAASSGLREQGASALEEDKKAIEESAQCTVDVRSMFVRAPNGSYRASDGTYRATFAVQPTGGGANGLSSKLAVTYSNPAIKAAVDAGKAVLLAEKATIKALTTTNPVDVKVTLRGVESRNDTDGAPSIDIPMHAFGVNGVATEQSVFDAPMDSNGAALIRKFGAGLLAPVAAMAVALPSNSTHKFALENTLVVRAINLARNKAGEGPLEAIKVPGMDGSVVAIENAVYDEHAPAVDALQKKFFTPLDLNKFAIVIEPVATEVDAEGNARPASFVSPLSPVEESKKPAVSVGMRVAASVQCRVMMVEPTKSAAAAVATPSLAQSSALIAKAPSTKAPVYKSHDDIED